MITKLISKTRGEFVAVCDECAAVAFSKTKDDARAFVVRLLSEGWKVEVDGEDWSHLCPDCHG